MTVSFQLDADLEQHLRGQVNDLDDAAKEALLVAVYRQGKLSHVQLSRALGLDRLGTEHVLKRHGVLEDRPEADDIRADQQALRRLLEDAP